MPIYEYVCKACGNEFEKLVPLAQKDAPECPKCGGNDVKKKISAPVTGKSNCASCSAPSRSSFT